MKDYIKSGVKPGITILKTDSTDNTDNTMFQDFLKLLGEYLVESALSKVIE